MKLTGLYYEQFYKSENIYLFCLRIMLMYKMHSLLKCVSYYVQLSEGSWDPPTTEKLNFTGLSPLSNY